jgi:hypothetical protein
VLDLTNLLAFTRIAELGGNLGRGSFAPQF